MATVSFDQSIPPWNTNTSYSQYEIVSYQGILYSSKYATAQSGHNPYTDTTTVNTYWSLAGGASGRSPMTVTTSVSSMSIVYANSSGGISMAINTSEATSTVIGIALTSGSPTASVSVQTSGVITSFVGSGLTVGAPVFLANNSAGGYTQDPTTLSIGNYRVLVGYALNATDIVLNISEPVHIISNTTVKVGLGRMSIWPASVAGTIATLPTSYLQCNGQSVSRTFYPDLFTLIGTTFGSTDSNSFTMPDWTNLNVKDNAGLAVGFYVIQAFADNRVAADIASSFPVGSIYPQYVGFGTPASLFGGTWTDVSSSMPQAAKGAIYASGSNGYGNYIQYCDGTMEQWGSYTSTATLGQVTVSLPQNFIDTTYVVNGTMGGANSSEIYTYNNVSSTTSTFTMWRYYQSKTVFASQGNANQPFQWHAIGKWSATAYSPVTFWQKTSVIGDAASTPPTLVQSAIYDSGSNANGSYIRYTDGTMICRATVTNVAASTSQTNFYGTTAGTNYYSDQSYSLPQNFIDTTYTINTNIIEAIGSSYVTGKGASAYNFRFIKNVAFAIGALTADIIAIGKWSTQSVPAPAGGITVSGIFDSGSNANGNYIRYTDGTMMQWGTFTPVAFSSFSATTQYGSTSGTSYFSSNTITLPQNFIDTTYSPTQNTSYAYNSQISAGKTSSQFTVILVHGQSIGAGPANSGNWTAIGKWSNTAVVPQTSQAVLMSGIYDSGSNANGNYIRYSEGTMIQWGSWTETLAITGANGTGVFYYNNTSWHSFPIPFISVPVTSISTDSSVWAEPRGTTAITMGISAMAGASETASRTYLWQAIGKWSTTAVKATTSFPTATTSPTVQDITVLGEVTKQLVRVQAHGNAGQTLTSGTDTTVIFGTEAEDTHNAYNPATGIFTAPKPGLYSVSAGVLVSWGSTNISATNCKAGIQGSFPAYGSLNFFSLNVSQPYVNFSVSSVIRITATGQTIYFFVAQDSGASKSIFTNSNISYHYLNITQLLGS